MLKNKLSSLFLFFLFLSVNSQAQNSGNNLFDNSFVHEIRIYFDDPNFWENMTQDYFAGIDDNSIAYTPSPQVIIDGNVIDTVGVRQKGFSSHFSSNEFKKSLKLDFDKFIENQEYDGLRKVNINNAVGDPGFLRDVLCYDIMRTAGVPAPKTAHAKIYLNDQYWGLYMLVEQVDKSFLDDNFPSNDGNLFKNMGWSTLTWAGNDVGPYDEIFDLKTNKTENDWSGLIELHNVINNSSSSNFPQEIQQIFDVPAYLNVLAIDIMTNNWDSYIEHGRNFYLYQEPNDGKFNWIPWDYNLAMGGDFNNSGNPFVLDTICPLIVDYSFQILGDSVSFTDESAEVPDSWFWDFGDGSNSVEQNPGHQYLEEGIYNVCLTAKKQYTDTLCSKTFCQQIDLIFNAADCQTVINGSCPYSPDDQTLVQVMQLDPFCCEIDWDGLCQEIYDDLSSGGSGTGGGGFSFSFPLILNNPEKILINRLMDVPEFREEYLNSICGILDSNFTTERLYPIIDATAELIRDDVYADPNYIFTSNYFDYDVGYGGQANGASIPQLKVFIEERIPELEEDFAATGHDCTPVASPIAWMDISINEIVADNDSTSTITDPAGGFDDWIELYNNTNSVVDLTGFYLSDDNSNPNKWAFPIGTEIAADGYLIIWADEQGAQEGLHAGFQLNKGGEHLQLVHADGTVIDSLNYGQQTTNIGYARVPNGTGFFTQQMSTFNITNDIVISTTDFLKGQLKVYPNPVKDMLFVSLENGNQREQLEIGLYNSLGQLVVPFQKMDAGETLMRISVEGFVPGHYGLVVRSEEEVRVVKVVIGR